MKVYLFLNLDDYADFEALQEHHHGRIKWVVNSVETCPFGFLESCPFYGLVEFDGKDTNIDPGGAFYSTLASFEGTVIMADIVDFSEKAKEILAPNAADFPESFDDYLRLIQEQDDVPTLYLVTSQENSFFQKAYVSVTHVGKHSCTNSSILRMPTNNHLC